MPRPGDSQHNSDVSNFGGNHGSRQTIPCDIKEDCTSTIFLGGIPRTLDERDVRFLYLDINIKKRNHIPVICDVWICL